MGCELRFFWWWWCLLFWGPAEVGKHAGRAAEGHAFLSRKAGRLATIQHGGRSGGSRPYTKLDSQACNAAAATSQRHKPGRSGSVFGARNSGSGFDGAQ